MRRLSAYKGPCVTVGKGHFPLFFKCALIHYLCACGEERDNFLDN